jgi:hypothetical protein
VLYDRIYRRDVLSSAYQIARANKCILGTSIGLLVNLLYVT